MHSSPIFVNKKTYTVEQFRKYLETKDSFGDVMYFLSEEHIDAAQDECDEEDLINEDL
jgi:hypothetical protein